MMRALATAVVVFGASLAAAEVYFEEKFETEEWQKRWVHSNAKGGNGPSGKFEWSAGTWSADEKEQKGLRTPKNMNYHGISAKFPEFSNKGKDLVLQFSVKHEGLAGAASFCGGGYIKLLGSNFDQAQFGGGTPYQIMFGPDLCGYDVSRIHLIFTYKGKNLLRNEDIKIEYDEKNEHSHMYTLVVKPDNTYEVYFDMKEKSKGSLHEFWDFPNKTTDDAADSKPSDWSEEPKINDPSAKKPADWVDEARIKDPDAKVPDEWDEEEDGVYEAPMIDNPKYKGAWSAEKIDNPAYKGAWKPKQIENPDFVEDVYAFDGIGAVGFELWTVNKGSVFDNILVTDSFEHAKTAGAKMVELFAKEKEAQEKAKAEREKAKAKNKPAESFKPPASEDDDDDDDNPKVEL